MKRLLGVACVALLFPAGALAQVEVEVEGPDVFLKNVPAQLTVRAPHSLTPTRLMVRNQSGDILARATIPPTDSITLTDLRVTSSAELPLQVIVDGAVHEVDAPLHPGLVSLLPPLIAIALALIFKEVVISLLAGIWLGALFIAGYNPLKALVMVVEKFARDALAHPDHASIVIFSLLLGGMVGILGKMGATRAIVDALTPFATTKKRGLTATWVAGLAIFFDDYANTLVVGNTMRPITDKLKISREKLAYIVDSTAAPVAAIVFVSTWVGYEISLIGDAYQIAATQSAGDAAVVAGLTSATPFAVFLQTVPYLFYPILAIIAVASFIVTGKDFGPMLAAERRAASGGGLFRPGAQLASDVSAELANSELGDTHWVNGVLPVATLVATVLIGLVLTGLSAIPEGDPRGLRHIISNADPFTPLLWGSFLACIMAVSLAVGQRILSLKDSMSGLVDGVRSMMLAMIILVCAWSLAEVTTSLGTAAYLSGALSDTIPIRLIPVTVFVVAAAMAFATGTSWGTMAILLPIAIPLTVALGGADIVAGGASHGVLLSAIAAVLSGAIFGDHCSPISDTTVLSSMASACDHVDHVRTQLPYALTVAGVAMVVGSLGASYWVPAPLALLLGAVIVTLLVYFLGRNPEEIST